MRRRHWIAIVVAGTLVVALATIGLVLRGHDQVAEAIAISDAAQWNSKRQLGMAEVYGAELRGDGGDRSAAVVLGSGPDGGTSSRLAVVDADSGKPRWTMDTGMRLDSKAVMDEVDYPSRRATGTTAPPVVVGSGDEWSVLVGYAVPKDGDARDVDPSTDDLKERGVAALSGKDGSVQWKTKLNGAARPLSTDGRTVLVAAMGSTSGASGEPVASYALDATHDGHELWKQEDAWVYTLAGDTALGLRGGTEKWQPGTGSSSEGHSVFALNARTGKEEWDLADQYDESALQGAIEGRAVVQAGEAEAGSDVASTRGVVIDTTNGREVERFDGEEDGFGYFHCDTDGRKLLACVDFSDPRLVTIRAGKDGAATRADIQDLDEDSTDSLTLDAVSDGRVYVSGTQKDDDSSEESQRFLAVDRKGQTLRDPLPGRVVAASANHVAVLDGERGEPNTLTIHRSADGDDPPPTTPHGKPSLKPMAMDDKPLWGLPVGDASEADLPAKSPDARLERLDSVELAAGTLLYSGEADHDDSRYAALDPDTGKQRWKLDSEKGLGGGDRLDGPLDRLTHHELAGEDDQLLVLEYTSRDDDEGVAAVSVKDGDVRWKQPLPGGDNTFVHLNDADESTFTVSVSRHGENSDATVEQQTLVYDLKTHRKLRTKDGTDPVALADGTVLAEKYKLPTEKIYDSTPTDVVAFDARSGKKRWTLGDRYDTPELTQVVGDTAVLVRHTNGTAVLDPTTGKELGHTPARLSRCSGTGEPLLVCEVGRTDDYDDGAYPATVRIGDDRATVRLLPGLSGHTQYRALGKWMFAATPASGQNEKDAWGGKPGPYQMLDAQGRPIAGGLPGGAVAADSDRVALVDGELGPSSYHDVTLTVHRRD